LGLAPVLICAANDLRELAKMLEIDGSAAIFNL
jgi:hypothetical protein